MFPRNIDLSLVNKQITAKVNKEKVAKSAEEQDDSREQESAYQKHLTEENFEESKHRKRWNKISHWCKFVSLGLFVLYIVSIMGSFVYGIFHQHSPYAMLYKDLFGYHWQWISIILVLRTYGSMPSLLGKIFTAKSE